MKKPIVVLNGVHGAGKTTLATLLEQRNNRYQRFPEIGAMLRQEVGMNALSSDECFDTEVIRRETARDYILLTTQKVPLIETWHIGNLAYVSTRSPQLLASYEERFPEFLSLFDPIAVFITIPWDIFAQRTTEKIRPEQIQELQQFYEHIQCIIEASYDRFHIPFFRIENGSGNLEANVKSIEDFLSNRGL